MSSSVTRVGPCASRSRSSSSSGSSTAPTNRASASSRRGSRLSSGRARRRCARRCGTSRSCGFVESEPFRGSRVREISEDGAHRDLPGASRDRGGRGARGGDPARRRRVDALEARARRDARGRRHEDDLHAQVEHDVAFHRLIVDASGNAILLETLARRSASSPRTIITDAPHAASTVTRSPRATDPCSRRCARARSGGGRRGPSPPRRADGELVEEETDR